MSTERRDALNRRYRFAEPQSTGKRIYPGDTGLDVFQHLDDHGPLSNEWLFLLMQPGLKSSESLVKRMCDFYNEATAPLGGQYVYKPWQQRETDSWKNQPIVYANTVRAWRFLEAAGRVDPRPANAWHEIEDFWHEYMIACITASIELACRKAGLTFLSRRKILGTRPLSIDVPITVDGEYYSGPLRPDSVFAVEWPNGGRRYFFLEADRDTEGVDLKSLKVKSYRRKLLQYREMIQQGIYKDFLGIEKGGVLCLHVTTQEPHMQTIIKSLTNITDGKGNNYNLFKHDPSFGRRPSIEKPTLDFGDTPWLRAVKEPINILTA